MLNEPEADNWAQVAPLLDDAMVELGESDRSALALRFFENKAVAEVAAALRMKLKSPGGFRAIGGFYIV